LSDSLAEAFDRSTVTAGQGGSIPLCGELQRAFPEAVICLLGVEEPACRIHAPNESVSAEEIRKIATAEALFLSKLGSEDA
jgi:acetylornithine deacetylase/succinyl-diaminopimelate desuccinylase-like protein